VNNLGAISELLLEMLVHESKQARFVLTVAKDTDLKFSPNDKMKPLLDLANHIAQIPLIDYKFFNMDFDNFEQTQKLEKELHKDSIDELLTIFDQGIEYIREHFAKLSDEEVLEKNKKPFYEEGPMKNWAHYLPTIVTHLAMHKMQLWMYLKHAGAPVNMMTYYGIPQSS
jgi:uncharacterized damage-inducible protein DinB